MSFNEDPNRTPEKGDSTRGCVYEDRDRKVGCRPPEEWVGRGSIERDDLGQSLVLRRRGGRELELSVVGHHTLEADTNTLNDTQEDSAHDGRVTGGLDTTTDSQSTTSEKTSNNAVPRVLGFANALNGAIECREHATPNTKVTTEHGSAGLDGRQGTYPTLTIGAVTETLDTVPDSTTNSTHAESTTKIAQGDPGAGISGVVHYVRGQRRRKNG